MLRCGFQTPFKPLTLAAESHENGREARAEAHPDRGEGVGDGAVQAAEVSGACGHQWDVFRSCG